MGFAVLLVTAFFAAVFNDYVDCCYSFKNLYHQLDTTTAEANYEVADNDGIIRVAVGDLQADLQFLFFGWTFPFFSVPVLASGGILSLWGGLRRSDEYGAGIGCGFYNGTELDSWDVTLTSASISDVFYERMIAKFPFWEIEYEYTFDYIFQPAVKVSVMQNSSYCGATDILVIHPVDSSTILSAMAFRNHGVLEIVSYPFFFFSTLGDHVIKLIQAPLATLINDHVVKSWCKKYHE